MLSLIAAKGQGIPRDDVLLHVDNTDSTLLHLAVESGVAKVHDELKKVLTLIIKGFSQLTVH